MAKANTQTSFWHELLNGRLFKPSQGRVVRQVTALAVFAIFAAMAYRLYGTILSEQAAGLRIGLPAAITALGAWLAYRLVNWPTFANFLISVEAEMDKVSWATWDYLKRATAVVLIVMVILGAYLFFCDIIWQQLFIFLGFFPQDAMN